MSEDYSPAEHERPASSGRILSLMQRYRSVLRRFWWLPVLCIPVAMGIEAMVLRSAPAEYASLGKMIVNVKLNIKQNDLYSDAVGDFLGTQQLLMKSDEVQNRVRQRLAKDYPSQQHTPVNLEVTVPAHTTVFMLRATGPNPQYTKAYLQASMEEFQNLKKGMEQQASDVTIANLTDEMLRLEPQMKQVNNQIAEFLSTNGVGIAAQTTGIANYLSALYQRLANAKSEYDLLSSMNLDQSLMLEQRRTMDVADGSGDPAGAVNNDGDAGNGMASPATDGQGLLYSDNSGMGLDYLTVKQQILLLKSDMAQYAEYLKPMHPKMIELQTKLDRLTRLEAIYKKQSVEQLEARKSALALEIKNLEKETSKVGDQSFKLSQKNADFMRLQDKSQRLQGLYDQLLNSLQTLEVNKNIGPHNIVIYEPASDAFKVNPMAGKKLVMAGFLGLVLGLGLILGVDRLGDRIYTSAELEDRFTEVLLAQIPCETKAQKKRVVPLLQPKDPRHPFVEGYRNLRSSLLYRVDTGRRPHVLLVTSAVPGEGKTVTAANLAITLAAGGSRVLLVDADLRKGTLIKRFDLADQAGLTECLTEGVAWRTLVKPAGRENLDVLPRGTPLHGASEYFTGPVMASILQEAVKEYDYVLIDSVPVMAADDVTSLAPRVDGVVFVVRAERTSGRIAQAAMDMLIHRRARIFGLVFNAVQPTLGDFYNYYRYRSYYSTHAE